MWFYSETHGLIQHYGDSVTKTAKRLGHGEATSSF